MKSKPAFYIAVLAVLSGISYGMMFIFHIPIFPAFPFLRLDFADIGVALGAIMFGPIAALTIAFVKCALYLPFDIPNNVGIGMLSNFICCATFGLALSFICRIKRNDLFLIIGLVAAVLIETTVALFSNYFIVGRLFILAKGAGYKILLTPYYIFGYALPFNLIKFGMTAAIAYIIFKALQRALPPKYDIQFKNKELPVPNLKHPDITAPKIPSDVDVL